jgi:hypothetical protein
MSLVINVKTAKHINAVALVLVILLSVVALAEADQTICEVIAGQDGLIDSSELMTAVGYWSTQSPVPGTGGQMISSSELMTLVGLWAEQQPCPSGSASIPDTTEVLDDEVMQNLISISQDQSSLVFAPSPTTSGLAVGDVIVSGPSDSTPQGLLRKVSSVSSTGTEVRIHTTPATLTDAIETGEVSLTSRLTRADVQSATPLAMGVSEASETMTGEGFYISVSGVVLYDEDNNLDTTDDQITANGSISFDPWFDFGISIHRFHLSEAHIIFNMNEEAQLQIETKVNVLELHKKRELYRYNFAPIVVWAGYVPVVITPILTVNVGIDGEVSVGIGTGVSLNASLSAGVRYNRSTGWSRVDEHTLGFDFEAPSLSVACKVKGYIGPKLSLLLYGLVGPYCTINGYLEIDADLLRVPWWILYGGLEAGAGIRFEVLGREIVDYYDPRVIGYRRILAQAAETGILRGNVKDAVSSNPISGVQVEVYDTLLVATGVTDVDGIYQLSVPAKENYRVEFHKDGYLSEIYYGVDVEVNSTKYLETVLQVDTEHGGTGSVSGTVRNALNGQGVADMAIALREGINVTSGPVVVSTTTASDGTYSFTNLDAGSYTAEVSAAGYNTTYFTVLCVGGTETADQDATVTPVLPTGEIRIILTWGDTPQDLDSHLTGPLTDETRFHMYYPLAETNQGSPWPEYVKLDLDDVTSYGPETTTIYQVFDGTYRFSVHDYTNRNSTSSTALSNSSAQVRVYSGSDLINTFNVPAGSAGTVWTVFEILDGSIVPINTFSYESSPPDIQGLQLPGDGVPAKHTSGK